MKLMSMTDFVLEQKRITGSETELSRIVNKIFFYAVFLKQPLTLGMFVPAKLVNGEWVVLGEPQRKCGLVGYDEQHYDYDDDELREYTEAKERVLFEGFEIARSVKAVIIVSNGIPIHFCAESKKVKFEKDNYSVEDLLNRNNSLKYDLELTQSAIKQIGL